LQNWNNILEVHIFGSVHATNWYKLVQKLSDARSERQQQDFEAMITLGNYVVEMGPQHKVMQQNINKLKGVWQSVLHLQECFG
jgi:hypothetical protein